MPKKIDWDAIRAEFVSSERDLTYTDVASMFGVSRQAVELRASPKAEDWQVLRKAFRLTNNAPASAAEAHATKPDQSVHHLEPHTLEESSPPPTKQRRLQRQDINGILVGAIDQSCDALKELEPRSFEKTVAVLISLLKVYAELNPPTPEEWAELAYTNYGLDPVEMVLHLRKVCGLS